MELLSIEYHDQVDIPDDEACVCAWLNIRLSVSSLLLGHTPEAMAMLQSLDASLGQSPPDVWSDQPQQIAALVGRLILELERDLCEWPGPHQCQCLSVMPDDEMSFPCYELCVECIDEKIGRFSAQIAVDIVRLILRGERFNPRIIWVIDLVRQLRRYPRLRLVGTRVASVLGCSRRNAEWAIHELERYGYLSAEEKRRPRRAKGERILIVDDSPQIRDLLGRILEWLGYDVITAVNGEEGLIFLDWACYRAIFVDLMMPALGGADFLKRARAMGITHPIFIISAYDHVWNVDQLNELGATDYVPKPFSITEIENLVNRYL